MRTAVEYLLFVDAARSFFSNYLHPGVCIGEDISLPSGEGIDFNQGVNADKDGTRLGSGVRSSFLEVGHGEKRPGLV